MSRPALLDVSVLVALFDADHVHHETAHDWFDDHRRFGWATCATTEAGLVRVLASLAPGEAWARPAELLDRLRQFKGSGGHRFWSESVSLTDAKLFKPRIVRGHRQLTDIYLLGLAHTMAGCLITFDHNIPVSAVVGATRETLHVIAPAE